MNTTINISLPEEMYKDVKKVAKKKRYTSVSELIRNALRKLLYKEEVTENGFTPEFEKKVLVAEREPDEKDLVLETQADVRDYFKYLKKPKSKGGN